MMVNSINIYDINLDRIGVLYTWISLVWEEGYNTLGSFQLELQNTERVAELIKENRYCGIDESDTLMLIESLDTDSEEIIANGFPATVILGHRASDTVISNEDAETALRGLVSNMAPWDRVGLGDMADLGIRYTPQTSDQSIEEYCEKIGEECDIGFKFVHDKQNKQLLFVVYQPEKNVNAKYSTLFGNVTEIEYVRSDTNYKNVAMVAGSGEGDERITVWAGDTSSSGYERREVYIDARNEQPTEEETTAEYKQRLVEYGEGKLVDYLQVETITFNITNDVGLGEVAFVSLPEIGLRLEARVAKRSIKSQNNGTTRSITVGTPFNITRL